VFYGTNPTGGISIGGSITGCSPLDADFTLTSDVDSNPPGTTYNIDFGDGQNLTFEHEDLINYWNAVEGQYIITHTYVASSCDQSNNGYNINLIIENPCSQIFSTTGPVKVSTPAVPDFMRNDFPDDPIIACVNSNITFTNETIEGCLIIGSGNTNATNYYWDFNDDGIIESTIENPTYSYNTPGTYTIRMRAHTAEGEAGNCGSTEITREICVQEEPAPNFNMIIGPQTCVPLEVEFNNTTVHSPCATPEYTWNIIPNNGFEFYDGTDANSANPRIRFLQMGNYIVTLRAQTYSNGVICAEVFSADQVIEITDTPEITIYENNFELCGPQAISFDNSILEYNNNGQPINDYEWVVTKPDNSQEIYTDAYPTIDFDQFGIYSINLGIINVCGSSQPAIITVEVVPELSNIAIDATVNEVCIGQSLGVLITGETPQDGGGNYLYIWEIDEGNGWEILPGESGINLDYQEPLTFNPTRFRRTVTARICEDADIFEVTVSPNLTDNFISNDQTQYICSNTAPDELIGSLPNGGSGIYDYLWEQSIDQGQNWTAANGVNDEINYAPSALSDNIWYRRTISSGNCISISDAVSIEVYGPIVINTITSNTSQLCAGNQPEIINGSTPAQAGNTDFSFQWQSSTDGINYTDIAGADEINYSPGPLNETTFFRRLVLSGAPVPTGCNLSESNIIQITAFENPTADAGTDFSIPYGTSTNLNATVDLGTPPYVFQWDGPVISPNSTSTATEQLIQNETFIFTVTDDNNCVGSDEVTVSITGGALQVDLQSSDDQICNGTNVTLTAVATGGNDPNYSYTWSSDQGGTFPDNNLITVSPVVTTTYTVSVFDGFNTVEDNRQIVVSNYPNITSQSSISVCSGYEINYDITSDVPGTTFEWTVSNPQPACVSGEANGSGSNIHQTLVNSCIDPVVITYTIIPTGPAPTSCPGTPFELDVTIRPQANSTFQNFSINTGTSTIIQGDITGGTGSYLYSWAPAAMIQGPANVLNPHTVILNNPQDYTLTVTDGANCSYDFTITVNTDGTALDVVIISDVVNDEICSGETITLTANASGGSGSYDYDWSGTPLNATEVDNTISFVPQQLGINSYSVTVYDGFTSVNSDIDILVHDLPVVNSPGNIQICSGEAIDYAITSNIAGTSFSWTAQEATGCISGFNAGTGNEINDVLINSCSDPVSVNYTIIPTGPAPTACTGIPFNLTVTVSPEFSNTFSDQNISMGTSTTLTGTVSGGTPPYSYSWSPANMIQGFTNILNPTTVNLFDPQLFTLMINDNNNCSYSLSVTVTPQGDPLSVEILSDGINDNICDGEQITLTSTANGGSGNYTYTWQNLPPNATIQNNIASFVPLQLGSNIYNMEVFDGFNYTTESITIIVNEIPAITSPLTHYICSGTTINYDPTSSVANSTFNWTSISNPNITGNTSSGSGALNDILFNPTTSIQSVFYSIEPTGPAPTMCVGQASDVEVFINPIANITNAEDNQIVISGQLSQQVNFTSDVSGVIYNWTSTSSCPNDINYAQVSGSGPIPEQLVSINPGGPNNCSITYEVIPDINGCPGNPFTYTMIINTTPSIFDFTGDGSICFGENTSLTLEGSEVGISYQLLRNGAPIQSPQDGTGNPLTWSDLNLEGTYEVLATNPVSGLTEMMNGSIDLILRALPTAYQLTIQTPGNNCLPIILRLNGSQIDVTYHLYREELGGQITEDIEIISGTGSPINFAEQTVAGTYFVMAFWDHGDAICERQMNNEIIAYPLPIEFDIEPQGIVCENTDEICLSGSEPNVNYQLWFNNQPYGAIIPGEADGSSICLGPLNEPGTFRIRAWNTITGCDIFYQNTIQVEPLPIIFDMAPEFACAGTEIILEECQAGIDYYLYLDPSENKQSIQVAGPIQCVGGILSFGPQYDAGEYSIQAVNSLTNCSAWMNGSTTIYPNPEIFEMAPQGNACPPVAIYLENYQLDVTYYLYRDGDLILSDDGSDGSVNFGSQTVAGTYTIGALENHPNGVSCETMMSGSLQIFETPAVRTLLPAVDLCAPASFYLNSSETGITYELWSDVSGLIQSVVSTDGGQIDFAPVSNPGQYYARAVNGQNCSIEMDGIRTVLEMPVVYTLSPQGNWCADEPLSISLSSSDIGFTYELFLTGNPTPIEILTGTGSELNFSPVITPGTYYIIAINDVSSCSTLMQGEVLINIMPEILSDNELFLCNDQFTNYIILSDVPDATYSWIVTDNSGGAITGFADGTGNLIDQQLVNASDQQQYITYSITPTGPAPTNCVGNVFELTVFVEAVSEVTNPENSQSILSGDFTEEVIFSTNIIGQTVDFNWSASPSSSALSGYTPAGTGDLPSMQVFIDPNVANPPNNAFVEYTVTPSVNGCEGVEFTYTIQVQLRPNIFDLFAPGATEICNDGISQVPLELSGSEAGVTYRLLLNDVIQPQYDQPGDAAGTPIQWLVDQAGIYTCIAVHDVTGVTEDMTGIVEIVGRQLPIAYNLTTQQPNNNCLPITPRLSNSEASAVYELLLEDINGIITIVDVQNGTAANEPLLFAQQSLAGIYTVRARISYDEISCEAMMNGSITGNAPPQEFALSPEGELCEDEVSLTMLGSEIGVEYSLILNGIPIGNTLAGTGNPISFGILQNPGTYMVHAINTTTSCEIIFAETITINSEPQAFSVFPVNTCPNSEIFMTECEAGIDYYVYFEASVRGVNEFIEVAGPFNCGSNGINFGAFQNAGIYRIKAVNPTTNCSAWMDNNVTIWRAPIGYDMSPQGTGCGPITFTMEDFEEDVTYFLLRDGTTVETTTAAGGTLSFSPQTETGIYTISAQFDNGGNHVCNNMMLGQFEILPQPEIYTLRPIDSPICPPAAFFLTNSQAGVVYQLYNNQTGLLQQITSTVDGEVINFDPVNTPGEYWATATLGNCEAQMNGIRTVSPLPTAYNITPSQGQWCSDDNIEIGLSDSDLGFTYQLHRIPFSSNPIATVSGDGDAITFGTYTEIGNYRVLAIDDATACERWMNGEIQINDPPLPFNITANGSVPQSGWNCPPVEIGLQLSETGVNYTLYQPDGTTTLAGTGAALIFGNYSTSGEYYVVATNSTTTCSAQMPGTINIFEGPEIFTLTSVGEPSYCFGDDNAIELVLNSSQPGVIYQLFKDDISNPVMAEIAGTGELLSWFPVSQFGEGNYFVMAHLADDPTCSATMNGNIAIDEIALPSASIAGSTTICESYCTTLNFDVTADLPFELIYTANGSVQPPLNFDPSDPDYSIEVCPTEQTIYEIVSVNYTVHPYCQATDISGSYTVFVDPLPIAETGPGGIICETQGFHFGSAFVENASNWSWEIHEGQGSFDNPAWITPVFYPDPVIEITEMTIRLVAYGSGECVGNTDTSFAVIQVYPQPQAFAGMNDSACVNSTYPLSEATAENYSAVQWEVISGSGSIDSPNSLNPNYLPHQSDVGTTVTLQLTATGEGPCDHLTASSLINIYIEGLPTANAGPSLSTCVLDPIQVTQATASHYSTINWTHTGNGTLTNTNAINPIYFPDITDAGTTVTLTLTATGVGSCESEVAVSETNIQIDPLPEVFAGNDNFTCELEAFQLDEATATHTSSTIWSIVQGNGTINDPDELNATYTPAASDAGTTVILRLRGFGQGNCSAYTDDSFINIEVITSPEANFEVATSTCVNELVSFEDASTTNTGIIEQWIWNFGDQSPEIIVDFPDDPNVNHTYTGPGNFVVTLTVVNSNGCEASTSQTIQITPAPIAAFVIQGGLCAESPVNFIDLSQEAGGGAITSWDWNFGDGNSSDLQNPVHSYDAPGTYTVTLTAYNESGCASNTFEATITINQAIQVEIDDSNLFACADEPYQFTAISADAVFWFWDFGDGNTSTEQNPQHAYATSGAYFVTLTGTSMNGCSNTDEVMLIVNPEPVAGFNASQTACTNEAILFTDTSVTPNGVITEWQWDMGDGTVYIINNPNNRNITHQFATPNQFLVSLTITDAAGCTDTHTQTVVVQPGPVAMFTYSATCTGQPVIFTDLSIPNGGSDIVSWNWDFGDIPSGNNNTSNLQNPAHTFVGEMPVDGYTVSLTVTNATGCTATISQQVFVDDTPFVEIIPSETEICLTESILFSGVGDNVVSWFWTFGDGNTSTLQNPTHTYLSAGTYNVSLSIVTAQGCTNDASVQVIVNHVPSAGFTTNSPVCLGSPVQFNNTSVSPNGNIQTWIWDFGDGTTQTVQAPNNPNIAYTYMQPGIFNVILTVIDNAGCEDDFTRQVNIQNNPLANFTFEQTCFGEPVLFTDLSSPNGGSDLFSWAWDFGDPLSGVNNSSSLQNPSHLFTAPATYTVSLTVTNTQGCSSTMETEVVVSETVAIDFSYNALSFCPGETIDFTPAGVDIVSYNWDFGDGGTSIQQTPQYVYTEPGTYTVSLTVTAIDGCQGYVEHTIIINEEPLAAFSTDSPSCSGAPTQFFNASSSPTGYITEWIWNFGDGSSELIVSFPDNPDVSHLYSAQGTYNASLTVTNSNGCSNTVSQEVIVAPGPIAAFDYTGTCAESPVIFTDLSQENGGGEIVGWQWDFGDLASGTSNTSTLQNPSHIFSASGQFDVSLIITNINGCTDTVINSVIVDEALLVEITSDNDTLCLGTPVNFTGNATGAVIWYWDFGDGNTSTQQYPEHTYTQTGNFMVTLTAETPDGCSNTDTLNVVVRPIPSALFTSTSPVCSSDSVYFTNQSTTSNGFIQTWIWDMDDGSIITIDAPDDPNIAYQYANPGTFEVVLTVIDNAGCEHSYSRLVQVEASPVADFSYDESCFGTPVLFTDLTSTNGGPDLFGWQWYFGDPNSGINNTSTLQNPSHLFTAADTFNVTLIVSNTIGCTDTITKELIVSELPEVDFTIADDSICLNTPAQFTGIGENINTWFWQFGDGGTSIQQNPSYMYVEPGAYDVTLTVTGIDQCQNSISYPIFVNDVPIADFSMNNSCQGDTTYFTDETVSLNGFIVEWAWDFGDGNTSDLQNPVHYYDVVDDYLVTLTVTDNFGCFETISRWVSIYDKPNAGFSFNQVCDPSGQVFFFDESESSSNGSPILVYEWNFHDGYFSNEINPNHIFPETDTCYIVSLTITDAFGCESIATDTICIWEPITVDFTSTEVCFGNATFFEASYQPEDDSIVSYAWNFNDGSDIFLTYRDTTSHIFANAGTFFVELTATNLNGCENTTYKEVVVNGLPEPDFEYIPGLCELPAQFTDLSDGNGALIERWFWNFGDPDSGPDNTSDLQNPTHLFSDQGGIYEVTLVVTNFNGCVDSITKAVIQDPCVQASFIAPSVTLCAESEICFIENSYIAAQNGIINRWIWNFGDNTPDYQYISPENPVCHAYTDPEGGEFVVSLTIEATVNGNAFTDTYTELITINPRPTARFIPEPACQNTDAIFTDNSIGNGTPITTWLWDFGDMTTIHDTSSMQNTSYQYPNHGQFDVQLIVINAYGCSDTIISEIEIWQPPTADFIAVDSCVSYITYFNDLSDEGGAPIDSWFWHFGDPNSNNDDGNPWTDSTATDRLTEHIYVQPGTYFTTLAIEDNNGCRDTVRHSLPVHPIPQASFTYEDRYEDRQGQVFFQNTSDPSATTFFWDFMTGQTSAEENPVYQFEEDGIYEVMLVAYNDHLCPDTAINAYEIIFTGLYFPNSFVPGNSDPELASFKGLGENLQTYRLEVYTSWGQLIWSSSALEDGRPAEAWDGTFNDQELPTGSYIWKASATFRDGTIWEGSDNGDGNLKPYGIINLIR
jgi:PKD repeat protein